MTTIIDTNLGIGGYGCHLDGSHDDTPGLEAHRLDAISKQGSGPDYNIIRCTVPAGGKMTPNTVDSTNGGWPFRGIKRLILSGYGATSLPGAATMLWGAPGHQNDSFTGSVTVANANAGDTSVTLPVFSNTTNISNAVDNGDGAIRLTVGSTTGFSTGQLVPITGTNFSSTLGRYYTGANQKIKLINGTTIDLPLTPFATAYDGGGGTVGAQTSLAFLGFEVGRWALMAGYPLQSDWKSPAGYPNNNFHFEYVKIAAIDTGTNTITFDRPLQNSYRTDWPLLNCGQWVAAPFPGGPATLFGLSSEFGANNGDWDCQHVYAGLNFDWEIHVGDAAPSINTNGRDITFLDCTHSGNTMIIPSQAKIWRAVGCNFPNYSGSETEINLEIDKLSEKVVFWNTAFKVGGSKIIQFQSSPGANDFIVGGGSNLENIQALGRRAIFTGASTRIGGALMSGGFAYGRNDSIYAKDLTIDTAIVTNACLIFKGFGSAGLAAAGCTISSGKITIPLSGNLQAGTYGTAWCMPDTWCFWTWDSGSDDTAFKITSVVQTDTAIEVQTTLSISAFPHNPVYIAVCPCPDFYFDNVAGQSSLSGLTPRANIPITAFGASPVISIGTNNGITHPTVPRSFLAKF